MGQESRASMLTLACRFRGTDMAIGAIAREWRLALAVWD
jgi:hypothetical protein